MAQLRRVTRKGSVIIEGREYLSKDLAPYVGEIVSVFVDDSIGGADAVCHTKDGEFITNAQNPELWAFMVLEKGTSKLRREVIEIVQKGLMRRGGPPVTKVMAEEIAVANGLIKGRQCRKPCKSQMDAIAGGFSRNAAVIGKEYVKPLPRPAAD